MNYIYQLGQLFIQCIFFLLHGSHGDGLREMRHTQESSQFTASIVKAIISKGISGIAGFQPKTDVRLEEHLEENTSICLTVYQHNGRT